MLFVSNRNIISVSWGDHVTFGERDGKLDTLDALEKRMKTWKKDLGAEIIHWRQIRTHLNGHLYAAEGIKNPLEKLREIPWDDFQEVPKLAYENGLRPYLYVSLFDEGWSLPPKEVREVSYHNSMHCQHVSWQSSFSKEHPEYTVVDRSGKNRQWGVLSLSYQEVRDHFCTLFTKLLEGCDFEGLFVCFRSQSRPADFADQYGFNEPVRQDYLKKYGYDILAEDFDLSLWRNLEGDYITLFLQQLRQKLKKHGIRLSVGISRGEILGPPMGNTVLQWRKWVHENLVDELIINQNSSQCPSLWHQLWPMHRGDGYLQNYLTGYNLPSLPKHIEEIYYPEMKNSQTELFIARQWDERDKILEEQLLNTDDVSGLVYSSFRNDNVGPIKKGNWVA